MGEPGSKSTDEVLAELAVEREYVTAEKLTEARGNQLALRAMEIDQDLGLVLFEMHLLTEDQLHELRKAVAVKTGEARLVAGYEVISEAGRGGFGVVYKARKLDTGDIVALKILPPSLASEDLVARFKRESRLVRKLGHENIVRYVEFGYDPKRKCHFCALEFIDGENLEERIVREGVLSEDDAISITYQIAKALQHAHFNKLVHRDVKPANVMITPEGTAKLLDLGLARPASQEATRLTKTGTFMGTAHYVSPEQAKSVKGIDIRSDIYSLGATLYYMITGRPPFEGETMLDVIQKHVYEQLEWPADINPAISEGLCLVVSKMMAKDPADRYQVPKDLVRELDELKEGRAPEIREDIREKLQSRSTIARMGAVVQKRRRPASRGGRRPVREDRPVRERGRPGTAIGTGMPQWIWMALGAAGLVIGLGLVLVMMLGGKEEGEAPLPPPAPPVVPTAVPGAQKGATDEPAARTAPDAFREGKEEREGGRFGRSLFGPSGEFTRRPGTRKLSPPPAEARPARTAASSEARPPNVPEGAVEFGGHWYRLYDHKMKWHDAKRFCEEKGGHLVTITSKEENDFVRGLARGGGRDVWIGLTDEKQQGRWQWVTGERVVFTGWHPGQPDDYGARQDIASIGSRYGFEWADRGGTDEGQFICEWEPAPGYTLVLEGAGTVVDTWLNPDNPDRPYHRMSFAYVQGWTPDRILLRFKIPSHLREVRKAILVLYLSERGAFDLGFDLAVHKVKTPWQAQTTTYVKPWKAGRGPSPGMDFETEPAATAKTPVTPCWVEFDVTKVVQAWCEGEPNCGFVIKAGDGKQGRYKAKLTEAGEKGPKLVIEAGCQVPKSISAQGILTLDLGGGVTMEFVYIRPGVFMMGDDTGRDDEKPVHEVAITRGFCIGKYEVTRGQFAAFVKATGHRTEAEREGK